MTENKAMRLFSRHRYWLGGTLLLSLLILGGYRLFAGGGRVSNEELVFHSVQAMDLPITITERGNLESQQNIEVICEVDDVRRDSINGTPIVWLIENGASVKKGDLLVELDSSPLQERVDGQIIDTERAKALEIQSLAQYENQITQNQTSEADAELRVKLAELELKMYVDKESGTYQLEVEQIKRTIDDVNNEILAAQANLELKGNQKLGIESLFKLGYAGKSELERSRFDFLQAESQYAAKMNRLRTQLSSLDKKETYEREMELLRLEGAMATMERNLQQAIRNNEAKLAQSKAAMESAKKSLKKELERLARYQDQLAKCKIYAPEDGMVAYAVSRYGEIREGVAVRQRQHLLSLPNLTHMQVKTSVHESVLDQIATGLPTTIRVDAGADVCYHGSVQSVAVLPDQTSWSSSDTKVYKTIVKIDEAVTQIKPGMTAVVDIHVDLLHDVIAIPIQAVVQAEGENWCYVESSGSIERRHVEVGLTDEKFVEIPAGLDIGERVVLNPMSISDEASIADSTRTLGPVPSAAPRSPSASPRQPVKAPAKKIAWGETAAAS